MQKILMKLANSLLSKSDTGESRWRSYCSSANCLYVSSVSTWSHALNSKMSSPSSRRRDPNWNGSDRFMLLDGSCDRCAGFRTGSKAAHTFSVAPTVVAASVPASTSTSVSAVVVVGAGSAPIDDTGSLHFVPSLRSLSSTVTNPRRCSIEFDSCFRSSFGDGIVIGSAP